MAGTTDPRAAGFDAAVFKDAIRFAMRMGAPQPSEERATFRWHVEKDYNIKDSAGNPYTWDSVPTSTTVRPDVRVDVAVEFIPRNTLSEDNQVAAFDTPRAIITMLDDEFALIEGADAVLLGGNVYTVDFVAPPIGLFDVTIYQIHCTAVDET